MDGGVHTTHSVGLSMLAGIFFAFAAAFGSPIALIVLPIPVVLGAMFGLVCSPAAVYARADMECRPTFITAVLVPAHVAWVASLLGGPIVAVVATFVVYVGSCVGLGLLARRARRRLEWYRSNRCTTCGYDMTGLPPERCPECGNIAGVRPRIRVPMEMLRP